MNKGLGRAQQKRGHKRIAKVLAMRKRRNPKAIKPIAGDKYLKDYLNG